MADAPASTAPLHRIAKLLARAGVASRREIERMVADGRVAHDGVTLDTPATLLPSLAGVTVDGVAVEAPQRARLFLFHKPAGVLTAERDPRGRATIYDRLPRDLPRTVPVGRLDLATEGLLLMTTDGGLKRELELPATGLERVYRARAYGDITQEALEALIDGVEIEGVRYGSIDANMERRTGANVWIELKLTEGKNREVRRVLEYLGLQVSRLIRTRYGPFVLADLPEGAVGEVRAADLVAFRQLLGRGRARGTAEGVIAVAAPAPAPKPPRPAAGATRRPVAAKSTAKPAASSQARTATPVEPTDTAKPPRPQRKAGWAKAKPRPGPARPRKRTGSHSAPKRPAPKP